MASAKRRKRKKKLEVLPRALIRRLAREWAENFRERIEDFIPKPAKKKRAGSARRATRPHKPELSSVRVRPPQPKAPELPTLIPLTKREAKERSEQRRLAELEVARLKFWATRDELEKVKADIRRLTADVEPARTTPKPQRGMTAEELQTIYRHGSDRDEVIALQKKQFRLQQEFDGYQTSILKLANSDGVPIAIDTARFYGVHPDEWADDLAYDYDLDQSDLYEEFFYPSDGSTTW